MKTCLNMLVLVQNWLEEISIDNSDNGQENAKKILEFKFLSSFWYLPLFEEVTLLEVFSEVWDAS